MGSQSEHDSIFGEEDEDVIFDEYARIKKYDGNGEKGSKSWGHVKLFKHKKLGNVRVCMTEELFRRPSIFATHPISSEMGLWSRDDGYLYWDTNQYYFCSRFSSDEATEKFARMFRESVESEKRKKYDASIQLERQGKLFERIITGEEVEDVLLQMKSKLYEFERKVNQWKELCDGTVKLLKHKLTGKVRLVMRSKSLNIYANHRISSGMLVDVYASNYTSCVWAATDFYKGHSKEKLFRIHFESVENCDTFMQLFRETVEREEREENYAAIQLERQLKLGDTKTKNVGKGVPITEIEKQSVTEDGKSKTAHEELPVEVVIATEKEVEEKVIEVVKVVDVFKGASGSSSSERSERSWQKGGYADKNQLGWFLSVCPQLLSHFLFAPNTLSPSPISLSPASPNSLSPPQLLSLPTATQYTNFKGASGSSNSIEMLLGELGRKKIQQYSHMDLTSITENFSGQIGSGAYGDVFKGTLPNGVKVAVKKLKGIAMDVMEFTFLAEVRTMSSTLHRHLVVLYGYCFEANMKALIYEYLDNGSFDKILYENYLNLQWENLYDIAIGTAKGLSYLHEGCVHEIIHYDVKPSNVLLDSKLSPKVSDFGMAKVSQRDLSKISLVEFRGTRSYAAPEMWMQMPVTSKSDVYSFGMMLFEVLGRRSNLDGETWLPGQVWEKFKIGKLDEILDDCGIKEKDKSKAKTLATVALWCTQYRPNDRPLMSVVVQVLLGNIQLPSPPNPFYPYCESSSASTGGSTNINGTTASSVFSTTST